MTVIQQGSSNGNASDVYSAAVRYECTPRNRRSSSVHRDKHCNSVKNVFFSALFPVYHTSIRRHTVYKFYQNSTTFHVQCGVYNVGVGQSLCPEHEQYRRPFRCFSSPVFPGIQFRCERFKQIENNYCYRKQTTSLLILQRTSR